MKKQVLLYSLITFLLFSNMPAKSAEEESRETTALKELHAILDEELPTSIPESELKARLAEGIPVMEAAKSLRIYPSDLANLVREDDLANLYRQHEGMITGLCENTSDERLKNYYPLFKVVVAYWLQCKISNAKIDGILTLVCSQSSPSYDSFNLLLLRSLNPLRNDIYYQVLYEIVSRFQPPHTGVMSAHPQTYFDVERFAFELLRVGKNVEQINNILFKTNPAKELLAGKLAEWCRLNSEFVSSVRHVS
jgi:hypothetical protein